MVEIVAMEAMVVTRVTEVMEESTLMQAVMEKMVKKVILVMPVTTGKWVPFLL